MSDDLIHRIVEEIEYLRAKRAWTVRARPRLIVVHGHHKALRDCSPGETIEQASFSVRSRLTRLRVSPTGLVLLDVLARKRPQPLTAGQIERVVSSNPFYLGLGANANSTQWPRIGLNRRTIKVYIPRLHRQIGKALKEAGLAMRPEEVLLTEDTELLNVKAYRLAIPCQFVHLGGARARK